MKKIIALVMAVLFVVALFAGCGGNGSTNSGNDTPKATAAPKADNGNTDSGKTDSGNTDSGDTTPVEDDSPYKFAKGKFAQDENGMPLEKYNYDLPFCTTDETLTFWTCNYTPQWLETDYQVSPFPVELENKTGVHVEYQLIASAQRSTNFSVLLASDELPDMMAGGIYYYTGSFKKGIVEDNYFVNLYDYRDYIPNYLYEVNKDPDDSSMQRSVYIEPDIIGNFYALRDQVYVQNGIVVRGDWLEMLDMTADMFTTWQGTHDCLVAFKSQIETATFPITLFNTLESGGYHWNCFDTYCYVSQGMMMLVDENGKVFAANTTERDKNLMTELNAWYKDGLIDPQWQSWSSMADDGWMDHWVGDQIGYSVQATSTAFDQEGILDIEGTHFVPLADPVLYEGQILHVGTNDSRLYYGSACISAQCENIPLALTWMDYRYSDEGGEFMTLGATDVAWEYDENGNKRVTDFIRTNEAYTYSMHILCYACNNLVDPGLDYNYMHFWYDGGDAVIENYAFYAAAKKEGFDGSFLIPASVKLTDEESAEMRSFSNDLVTYIQENYLLFFDGSRPMTEWDEYVGGLDGVGLQNYLDIYQGAYDRAMAA